MNVTIKINGRYELELIPEDDIERLVLKGMAERAEMGRKLSLVARVKARETEVTEADHYVLGVDKA